MMCPSQAKLSYVLVTPARDEEQNIGRVIESVQSQTVLPLKWVIVDGGSLDRTVDIIRQHLSSHDWIELLHVPRSGGRGFSSKARGFSAGYAALKAAPFQIVGNLDADISFERDYLAFLLDQFARDPQLGVAGTPFVEDCGYDSFSDSFEGERHVPGGCQLFRRDCFDAIGGYIENDLGGIDWIAVTTARMMGWTTRSFPEKAFHHHRSLGTAENSVLGSLFRYGTKDYVLGNHPVWEIFRVLYRIAKPPYLSGGIALFAGYIWALAKRMASPVSPELRYFHRREEMDKLRRIVGAFLHGKRIDNYTLGTRPRKRT